MQDFTSLYKWNGKMSTDQEPTPRHSGMQRTPFVQGPEIWDALDPTALCDEVPPSHKLFCILLGKAPVFGDVNLLATRILELGPMQSLKHIPCSAIKCRGMCWFVLGGQCDSALGFPEVPHPQNV